MTELHVRIPDDVAERLTAAAADRHMAPEDVVAEVLEHNFPPRRRLSFVGVGRSGHHDTAARSEEILREHFAR